MKTLKIAALLTGLLMASGCAVLHHVQVGEVDARGDNAWVPFEIMMSETGISTEEIGQIARATDTKAGRDAGDAAAILGLFQMGPRTGNLIYSPRYAEKLIYQIHEKCPSGRVTGLMSIRETRKYPVISGEIVKVTGYCLRTRTTASAGDGAGSGTGMGSAAGTGSDVSLNLNEKGSETP